MKNIVSILVVFMAFTALQAQDFRKVNWGMTKSEVKTKEALMVIEEDKDVLVYETQLAGYDVYLGYIFTNGKLTRAKYMLKEVYLNNNEYISDFENLKRLLTKKYGEPEDSGEIIEEDSYWVKDKTKWGHAISNGELALYSMYRTPRTNIELYLYSEDYQIINQIEYTSTDPEINKLEEDKILEDL